MLLDLTDLRYKHRLDITGVLHVGAHTGEEAPKYLENSIHNVVWIEGNPEIVPRLEAFVSPYYGHRVIQALVTDKENEEVVFHITNNGQSSSVLDFGTHPVVSPDVHMIGDQVHHTRTIDSLAQQYGFDGLNMMNLDLQGAELLCLKGATETLKRTDYIYTEVNINYLYRDCVLMGELDEFLGQLGFLRLDTQINSAEWGDALYVRMDKFRHV